jgi:hypothetical protein
MKRLLLAAATLALLVAAVAFSQSKTVPKALAPVSDLQVQVESRNPWTNLRLNNDPADFRFAIVSDRTGGHRARIFSRAVDQLNVMQPEFVLSVGDLIEGYKEDPDKVAAEWREFQGYVSKLQMPFFYVPGNHDVANPYLRKQWEAKFGRVHYHFVYRQVLFLILNSGDPTGKEDALSPAQVAWAKKVLEENADVRWTVVAIHVPLWVKPNVEKNGWLEVERALADRPYTVFGGHVHRFQKFVRNGRNYYQLATTGGGSKVRGVRYGEFDQIAWVTMKKDGPVLANLLLDGIYPEDMKMPVSEEPGVAENRKTTYPVKGTVHLDGSPVPEVMVAFYEITSSEPLRTVRRGDAIVDADGAFVLSSYVADDGAPAGEYVVTVTGPASSKLPEKYAKPTTSDLRVKVQAGKNDIILELKR